MTDTDFTPAAPSAPHRRALLGGAVAVGAALTMGGVSRMRLLPPTRCRASARAARR
jgi:hypothetical protein